MHHRSSTDAETLFTNALTFTVSVSVPVLVPVSVVIFPCIPTLNDGQPTEVLGRPSRSLTASSVGIEPSSSSIETQAQTKTLFAHPDKA